MTRMGPMARVRHVDMPSAVGIVTFATWADVGSKVMLLYEVKWDDEEFVPRPWVSNVGGYRGYKREELEVIPD